MTNKFILTDVDGVLLNWGNGFEKWMRANHLKYGIAIPTAGLMDSMNVEEWLGMTYEDTRPIVRDFNNDPDWFPYLEPMADAVDTVSWLKREGYTFVAISACNDDEWHKEARRGNLEKYFPNTFDTIHLVPVGASKEKYLSRYRSTYWIEDHPRHAEEGARLGHMSFLITRSYNRHFKETMAKRVWSWKEIYDCITNDGCSHPGWIA